MPELEIVGSNGSGTGEKIAVSDKVFGAEENPVVVREVLNQYLANQRQGTVSTKTRSEIRGGSSKPWRQKGTGRARHGTASSPLWRSGGVTFGPRPRDFSYQVPKKKKRLALYNVLSTRLANKQIKVVKDIPVTEPKTRKMVEFLEGLGLADNRCLILVDKTNRELYLAGRNLPGVKVAVVGNVNIFDLLYYENIILTPESIRSLEESIG
jgi:large subunit ribosomal protein L4